MSFQFSDMLLYTSKGVTATNQFKVHGQLPLHGMIVSLQSLLLTSAIPLLTTKAPNKTL